MANRGYWQSIASSTPTLTGDVSAARHLKRIWLAPFRHNGRSCAAKARQHAGIAISRRGKCDDKGLVLRCFFDDPSSGLAEILFKIVRMRLSALAASVGENTRAFRLDPVNFVQLPALWATHLDYLFCHEMSFPRAKVRLLALWISSCATLAGLIG